MSKKIECYRSLMVAKRRFLNDPLVLEPSIVEIVDVDGKDYFTFAGGLYVDAEELMDLALRHYMKPGVVLEREAWCSDAWNAHSGSVESDLCDEPLPALLQLRRKRERSRDENL